MPIKLIQVQRKLNVGINTVVDFLHKKGFDVEDNPNTRISDEQYALLVKEFGKDLPKEDRSIKAARTKKEPASQKEVATTEIKTEIPDEFKPKIVMKGHIDLEGNQNKHQQEEPKVEKAPEKPVEKAVEAKPAKEAKPQSAPRAAAQEVKKEEPAQPVKETPQMPEKKIEASPASRNDENKIKTTTSYKKDAGWVEEEHR